ncbi:MAG: NAD(P)H-dependent flavin oxidoreductase [Hyphomicrobiales bacterium]
MLSTEFTRLLGIEHPIIQAGMGNDCGPELASAVSNAGALGTLGSIGLSLDAYREAIRRCRELTDRPFAANIVTWDWAPFANQMVDVTIEERVPAAVVSFGDPVPAIHRLKEAGVLTIGQVQSFEGARAALAAGPAALIVQGNEAGGHTGGRGTLNFAAQVLDIAGDTPIIIAGGVGNGRGLAAAIAMGAAGVVMGTRFKASVEFGSTTPHLAELKQAIVASDGSNTAWDEIFDEAYGMEWPNGIEGRALLNRFTSEWRGRASELRTVVAGAPRAGFVRELMKSPDTMINWAGESSGLVDEVLPAAEIIRRTIEQAERLLQAVASRLSAANV